MRLCLYLQNPSLCSEILCILNTLVHIFVFFYHIHKFYARFFAVCLLQFQNPKGFDPHVLKQVVNLVANVISVEANFELKTNS